ncbi:MAG: hypothetical protein IV100_15115 [Myxococcales bacterium]|nr:hypothetical protein [Myxococcales bacterium]
MRLALAALALTGCATLGGVVDEQARSVTWPCHGPSKARVQAHRLIVECPTGPAPTLVVESVEPVMKP